MKWGDKRHVNFKVTATPMFLFRDWQKTHTQNSNALLFLVVVVRVDYQTAAQFHTVVYTKGTDGTMLGGRRSLTTGPDRLVWSFSNELGLLLYTHQHSQTGRLASRQQPTDDPTKPNQPTTTLRQTRKQAATVHATTTTAELKMPFNFFFPFFDQKKFTQHNREKNWRKITRWFPMDSGRDV